MDFCGDYFLNDSSLNFFCLTTFTTSANATTYDYATDYYKRDSDLRRKWHFLYPVDCQLLLLCLRRMESQTQRRDGTVRSVELAEDPYDAVV